MKQLTKIPTVNERQVEFGHKLGLDLAECTISVALAKLQDRIDIEFWDKKELGRPSEKQIHLAAEFGYDISNTTARVGSAIVDDILEQLNSESICAQGLKPGDRVRNKWDSLERTWVISSIQEDGTVYFKGGNGQRAWARNLVKVDGPYA